MANQVFYNSTFGDPLSTRRRVTPQPIVGVPVYDMALYHDYRSNLGPMTFSPTVIAQRTLNGNIDRLVDLIGKIVAQDSTQDLGDFDMVNPMLILAFANLARKYSVTGTVAITSITRSGSTATVTVASTAALVNGQDVWITGATQPEYNGRFTIAVVDGTTFTYTVTGTPATPATGTPVYSATGYNRWLFSASQGTVASPRLTVAEDYDQGIPFRIHDCAVKSLQIGAQPNQNLGVQLVMALGEFTLHGAVTQVSGSGSTLPRFLKFWDGNLAADALDRDIYYKDTGAGLARGKIGSAASFGSIDDPSVLGDFSRVFNELSDEVDRRVGTIAEQIRAWRPVGATRTTNDVFKVLKRIAAWTPSYGVARPTTSVNATFVLNGTEIPTQGWAATIATDGVERVEDVYGRQSATTRLTGQVVATIAPTREIADRDLQNALLQGVTLPVILEMPNDNEIGTSGKNYRGRLVCPAVKFAGNLFSPTAGGKDRREALTGTAGVPDAALSYDGSSWADAWTMELRNDVTSALMATT